MGFARRHEPSDNDRMGVIASCPRRSARVRLVLPEMFRKERRARHCVSTLHVWSAAAEFSGVAQANRRFLFQVLWLRHHLQNIHAFLHVMWSRIRVEMWQLR